MTDKDRQIATAAACTEWAATNSSHNQCWRSCQSTATDSRHNQCWRSCQSTPAAMQVLHCNRQRGGVWTERVL